MNKVTYILIFFSLIIYSQDSNNDNHIFEGNKKIEINDFTGAEIDYRNSLSKDPNSTRALYNLGNSQYNSLASYISYKKNVDDMREAANYLIGKHDFSSFRSAGCQASSPIKTIEKILISKKNNIVTTTFIARSFLYNQVRIMTGTLKDVGSGLITHQKFKKILLEKNRACAGITAPAKGLTLIKICY